MLTAWSGHKNNILKGGKMNILSKTIVLIGVLLAICLFSFGIYMQDLLILSVGLLVALFSIVLALETQHILHNPFRK